MMLKRSIKSFYVDMFSMFLVLLLLLFETGFHYVALTVLELIMSMWTRLAGLLLGAGIKHTHHPLFSIS